MFAYIRPLAFGFALIAGPLAAAGTEPAPTPDSRILVQFAEGVTPRQMADINRRLGVTVVGSALDGRLLIVQVPYADTRAMILDAYAHTDGVLYAEPDGIMSIPTPVPDSTRSGPIQILPVDDN